MLTDLSSVPWFLRWFVGRVGPHLEASIVHDFLYIAWQDLGTRGAKPEDSAFADKLLCVGMEAAEVGWIKRSFIYLGVKLFGWCAYQQPNPERYVKDSPEAGA